jgi:hypothetical protein
MPFVCARCLTPLPEHAVSACPTCGMSVTQPPPGQDEAGETSNVKLLAGCGLVGCLGALGVVVLVVVVLGITELRSSSTAPVTGPVTAPVTESGGTFGIKHADRIPAGTGVRSLNPARVGGYGIQATYPLTNVGDLFRPGMLDGLISPYAGAGATVSLTCITYPDAATARQRVDAFYGFMVNEYGTDRVRRGNVVGPGGQLIGVRMIIEEPVTGPVPAIHPCFGHSVCQNIYWSNGHAVMLASGPAPHAASFHEAHRY